MDEWEKTKIERGCERLVLDFARFSDSGEHDRLAALFILDGLYERPDSVGGSYVGRDGILREMNNRAPRTSRHFLSNVVIDVLSAAEATGTAYYLFLTNGNPESRLPGLCDPAALFSGSYADRFVKVDGRWLIAHRVLSPGLELRVGA